MTERERWRLSMMTSVLSLAVALLFVWPGPLHADTAQYLYDDRGQLVQVIDGQGNVATYTYDAVGNLLAITRSTGGVPAPTITAITPTTAIAGTTHTVTLSGQNLQGSSLSTDNPGIVVSHVATTPTTITATFAIAFTARIGATVVTVTTSTGSSATNVTINASLPAMTALSPNAGPPTRLVTMTGTGFSATAASNQISFNGVPATVLRATPTQLLAQVPSGAVSGPVTVTVSGLTSLGVPFTVTTPSGPPPTVAALMPPLGSVQGGGQVTVTGSQFVAGTTVFFGAKGGQFVTIADPNTLRVTTPAAVDGAVDVVVSNANGDAFVPAGFTYLNGPSQKIQSITPTPGLINIARNVPISVSFARPVDRTTITALTFGLSTGGVPVAGTFAFAFNDTVVTLTSNAPLVASTIYTLSISQGIKSIDGIPLDGEFLGTFTTGVNSDTTSPSVSVSPMNGAAGVPFNSLVVLSFSEPLDPNSINATTVQVSNQGTMRNGSLALGAQNTVVTFTAASPFAPGTNVTVTVSGLVRDVAGNQLLGGGGAGTDSVTSFTTANTADLFPPLVLQTNPVTGATGINPNSSVAVTFNEPVNPLTVTPSTLVVSVGGVAVSGRILLSSFNTVAAFLPDQPLPALSQVILSLQPGIADVAGNATTTTFTSMFTTAQAIDNFQPSVIAVNPPAIGGVPLNVTVSLVFSERINPSTVTSSNFRLSGPTGNVSGQIAVSADQLAATLIPNQPLLPFGNYTISYTTGIHDLAGNLLFNPGSASFSTGGTASDQTRPHLTAISPRNSAQSVPTNAPVVFLFSEPVATTSVNTQTVIINAGGVPVPGMITFDPGQNNQVVRWKPANLLTLQSNTFFQVNLTSGVTDAAGNGLTAYTSGFTTGAGADTTAPTVTGVTPVNAATTVPISSALTATFSEAIDPLTVNGNAVQIIGGGVSGSVLTALSLSPDGRTMTVTPTAPLFANATYTVRLLGSSGNYGLEDVAGNRVTPMFQSSFTTATAAGTNLAAVPTQATVTPNPTTVFADGQTTATVTISNINRSGAVVPNGTVVAVSAQTAYQSSAGGTVLGGTPSPDGRFRLFTTVGGSVTFTYQAPVLTLFGASASAMLQVASADAAGTPMTLLGTGVVTLVRSSSATASANPTALLANGTSVSEITLQVTDNTGAPAPAGVPIGVTVQPVYTTSTGGTLTGGTVAPGRAVPALHDHHRRGDSVHVYGADVGRRAERPRRPSDRRSRCGEQCAPADDDADGVAEWLQRV